MKSPVVVVRHTEHVALYRTIVDKVVAVKYSIHIFIKVSVG